MSNAHTWFAPATPKFQPMAETSAPPGTVLGTDGEGVLVATGQGVLRLRRLQRPGGRMLAAPEFLRGWPVAAGTVLAVIGPSAAGKSTLARAITGVWPLARGAGADALSGRMW